VALVGDPLQGVGSNPYLRINPAAFRPPLAGPGSGNIGLDSPRNYMRGPGVNRFDMSLQKNVALRGDRTRAELRADAFNVFNHTQFSGINSTLNFGVLNPATNTFTSPNTTQNGVIGAVINGQFIAATPSNLPLQPNGTFNKTGFGTVSGARSPRIMQLVFRIIF